ncbi:MAG: undecaprenyl-diphosphate phosphatase [FCB group bacterium]|nr:undecaprenyl-diphosphate phosphatase [FCB group bacterium]
MTYLDAILLGALQGLTEFLPISSSGHLVIAQALLGIELPGKTFEVILHLGSLGSILIVFRNDIYSLIRTLHTSETWKFIGLLVLATLPAAVIGIAFDNQIDRAFDSPRLVAVSLWITGFILLSTRWFQSRGKTINWQRGLGIGFAQALAIVPGISRSGSTISLAMALGVPAKEAARFSFLLALPAILGAGLLTGLKVLKSPEVSLSWSVSLIGFLTSLFVGWAALTWLIHLVSRGKFYQFSGYCFVLGLVAWVI